MDKEKNTGRSILSVGAAAAFSGMILYAAGQFLSYLFRDVDPDRKEQAEETEEKQVQENGTEEDKA